MRYCVLLAFVIGHAESNVWSSSDGTNNSGEIVGGILQGVGVELSGL